MADRWSNEPLRMSSKGPLVQDIVIESTCQELGADQPLGETSDTVPTRNWHMFWAATPLTLLVIMAFAPLLGNEFVNWDDDINFLNNVAYRGLGWAQVKWAWSTFLLGVYQPLAWLTLEAQYVVWQLDPWGYHLTSILLHATNAVVLYVLTVTLLFRCQPQLGEESRWPWFLSAGLTTGLFAVHPLRVEVVAWASCQPYLPCALFYMLAVLAYIREFPANSAPVRGWPARSFLLFTAALLFKAVAVTLPAVLLILDVYPLRRLGGGPGRWFGPPVRKVWWAKIPFFGLSALFMVIAVKAKRHSRTVLPDWTFGISASQVAQACYGIWFYIIKTLVPVDLIAYYAVPESFKWYAPTFLVSILATIAVSAWLFYLRQHRPGVFAVWLSYLVILAPSLGLVRISDQIAADRYSYVPMIGGVALVAAGLCLLLRRRRHLPLITVGLTAASLGAMSGLLLLTWNQDRTWKTTEALWNHALKHGSLARGSIQNFLGLVRAEQGNLDQAKALFQEAIRLEPSYAGAHNNLGAVMFKQGNVEAAEALFREALRLKPDDVDAHHNLGSVLVRKGKLADAVTQYKESLSLHDEDNLGHINLTDAHKELGSALLKLGRVDEAVSHYAEVLWLTPDDPESESIWKNVLLKYGKFNDRDVAEHVLAYSLNPGDLAARKGLVDALRRPARSASAP
jgi:tetratricopeptide (TPR) repeat protein